MTLTREQRAERALQILSDSLFKEGLDECRKSYVLMLRGCQAKDDLGRYRYAIALEVIDGVERHLKSVLNLGVLDPNQGQEWQADTILKKITRIF